MERTPSNLLLPAVDMSSELTADAESRVEAPAAQTADLRRYHWTVLLGAAAIVLAAFLLSVRPDQRVELSGLQGWPLPETCYSRTVFGLDCPGCGLTRSFVHLAHGDVDASLAVNRVGWVFAALVLLQFPYRLWAVFTADGRPLGRRFPWLFVWIPFTLLIANWLVTFAMMLI